MKPTYEELEAKVHRLEELLKQALEKIAQLEEQLRRNSKNSSKPPSTDPKGNTTDKEKPSPRASRAGKARPSFSPERIDQYVQCTQENCPHCGSSKIQPNGQPSEILQQAELPEIQAIITEYQLQKYHCEECDKNSTAPLPLGVPDSAFGPKLMGLLATLTGILHVAKREAVQLIKDLYGVDMGSVLSRTWKRGLLWRWIPSMIAFTTLSSTTSSARILMKLAGETAGNVILCGWLLASKLQSTESIAIGARRRLSG